MKTVKQIVLVVLMVLVIILMVQNAQPVIFRFLNWQYRVSQLLLVAIVLAIGFLAGYVAAKMSGKKKADDETFTPVKR